MFLKSLAWGTRNVLLYLNYIVCTIIIVVATNTSMPLRAGKTSCPLFSHCFIIFFCLLSCVGNSAIIAIDGIEMMVQKVLFLDAEVLL